MCGSVLVLLHRMAAGEVQYALRLAGDLPGRRQGESLLKHLIHLWTSNNTAP